VSKKVPAKNHWNARSPVSIGHSRRIRRSHNPSTAHAKPKPKQTTAEITLMGSILPPRYPPAVLTLYVSAATCPPLVWKRHSPNLIVWSSPRTVVVRFSRSGGFRAAPGVSSEEMAAVSIP
jgi:hypothetical protein